MAGLGIAGSAVGLASLGVQVCQGLLNYYNSWKDYSEDIAAAYRSIEALEETCELLVKALYNCTPDPDQERNMLHSLALCKHGFDRLTKKLGNLRKNDDPIGLRQVVKAGGLRLLYPFQNDTLDKIQQTVQDLTWHLKFALEVLHVDISVRTHTAVGRVEVQLAQIEIFSATTQNVTNSIRIEVQKSSSGATHLLDANEVAQIERVVAWLAASDPYINHNDACKRYEPGTGEWFLRSPPYQSWLANIGSRLWVYGKAGCCKTVLCSTVIEHARLHLAPSTHCAVAFFYFSFADQQKQNYHSILLSLVGQLSRGRQLIPSLLRTFESGGQPSSTTLEDILVALAKDKERTILILDALDEAPDGRERQEVMDGIRKLSNQTNNLSILMTSRPEHDIQDFVRGWPTEEVAVNEAGVNADIKPWVEKELERLPRLRKLTDAMKAEIVNAFSQKADGMFRWAYCQMEELAKLKVLIPKNIKAKLATLPTTLDETYERMLLAIDPTEKAVALKALKWLAFSAVPLDLAQMEEICIVNTDSLP
ncbi:hypothetical protein LTR36_005235 [Oleoguttula mirabilis]|uniref:NACHT domain-containing protein n=1 Tax=Oleoguttula mirabilis TaxID=1507867 RepID=A0AAV9JWL5_9PEZI|nr:hypothetical protein LTR36_005235 [Oleoguttula mirabilis]